MDIIEKAVLAGLGLMDLTKEKAEKIVDELVKRGELSQSDKAKAVKEMLKGHEERMKKIKDKIDTSVEKAVDKFKKTGSKEIQELNQKIDRLSQALEKLEKKLGEK